MIPMTHATWRHLLADVRRRATVDPIGVAIAHTLAARGIRTSELGSYETLVIHIERSLATRRPSRPPRATLDLPVEPMPLPPKLRRPPTFPTNLPRPAFADADLAPARRNVVLRRSVPDEEPVTPARARIVRRGARAQLQAERIDRAYRRETADRVTIQRRARARADVTRIDREAARAAFLAKGYRVTLAKP
jgi:hypothetical protein